LGNKGSFIFSIKYSNHILQQFVASTNDNWVDLERLFYENLLRISNGYSSAISIEKLNSDLEVIKRLLVQYLREVKSNKEIAVDEFFKDEEDEMASELVDQYGLETKSNHSQCLLNFNYTKTYAPYIREGLLSSDRFEYVIDIHGSIENGDIIFGYGDEMDENYKHIENLNDNKYLENVKSIEYLKNDNYSKLLRFIEDDYFYVYIMGHSCGLSDRTLLNTIFEHKHCVFIKLFYHTKKDGKEILGDNFKDLSMNISRHFDDKKELRRKVVSKDNCCPLPQWND